jgi:hypothetical protein
MVIKIEAKKPWANFEQVFDASEHDKAMLIYEALTDAEWTVKWSTIPDTTKAAYTEKLGIMYLDRLSEMFTPTHGVVQ